MLRRWAAAHIRLRGHPSNAPSFEMGRSGENRSARRCYGCAVCAVRLAKNAAFRCGRREYNTHVARESQILQRIMDTFGMGMAMSGYDPDSKTRRVRPDYLHVGKGLAGEGPAGERPVTVPVRRRVVAAQTEAEIFAPADVLHLAELVPVVRRRLDVPADFSDDAILASLKRIAQRSDERQRRQVAFNSNLIRYLSIRGRNMDFVLRELVALIPPPRM